MEKIKTSAIFGVGLIGGSFGKALLKKRIAKKVIGIGRNKRRLKAALIQRAVSEITTDLKRVREADLVVLATPVINIEKTLKAISPHLKNGCIVTDVGSTKEKIVKAVSKHLPKNVYFVGSHPIAGSEKSGVLNSSDKLFEDSVCVITPEKTTSKKALFFIKNIWKRLGAKTVMMSPSEHDRIIALTSHLPHFLVDLLVLTVLKADNKKILPFIGRGFKDTTRIAVSNPELWAEIAISNNKNVYKGLEKIVKYIKIVQKHIKRNDNKKLINLLVKAKVLRERI